jgi:hypothetical protein
MGIGKTAHGGHAWDGAGFSEGGSVYFRGQVSGTCQLVITIRGDVDMSGKSVQIKNKNVRKETPLVVWLWMLGMGFLSYIVARIGLYTAPHPYHWLSALGGGVIGYLVGWWWFRWKGDII